MTHRHTHTNSGINTLWGPSTHWPQTLNTEHQSLNSFLNQSSFSVSLEVAACERRIRNRTVQIWAAEVEMSWLLVQKHWILFFQKCVGVKDVVVFRAIQQTDIIIQTCMMVTSSRRVPPSYRGKNQWRGRKLEQDYRTRKNFQNQQLRPLYTLITVTSSGLRRSKLIVMCRFQVYPNLKNRI